MKVWILERGCKYEGSYVVSVHPSELSGLAAAAECMKDDVKKTELVSTPEDPCSTYFTEVAVGS